METGNDDLGNKKWNNEQELNEGFSGDHIPENYNPSDENISNRLRGETETDENGQTKEVQRARHPEDDHYNSADNSHIENTKSLQNRDRNYDTNPERYPPSHPDNHENRGNIQMEND
jgi:hypothetical protein